MSKIFLYSDPHLGLARKAHATKESVIRREAWCNLALLNLLQEHKRIGTIVGCLGDFFDKTNNSEEVILSTFEVCKFTDFILAGNHDIPNREGRASSLALLDHVYPGKVIRLEERSTEGIVMEFGSTGFFMAPHAFSQTDYDAVIEDLAKEASGYDGYRVLCLHCNYGLPAEFLNETTLNLSKERAYELMGTFHYILLGHVHTPLDDLDGRLKVIGSVFPTAFDNMTSKRGLFYDTETGVFEDLLTWDAAKGYWKGPIAELGSAPSACQYFDIEDGTDPGEAQKAAVKLLQGGAFFVRIRQGGSEVETFEQPLDAPTLEGLPQLIERELMASYPHLVDLWKRVMGEGHAD